jgi:hypothetical protein
VSVAALRATLADAISSVVDDRTTVYPTSVDGLAGFPAVVLGMPSWRPFNGCLSIWEFPVAVIVARPGTADSAMVSELDDLWPTVLAALIELRDRQEITDVTRADFGLFNVQGIDYPAQVLTCTLTTSS